MAFPPFPWLYRYENSPHPDPSAATHRSGDTIWVAAEEDRPDSHLTWQNKARYKGPPSSSHDHLYIGEKNKKHSQIGWFRIVYSKLRRFDHWVYHTLWRGISPKNGSERAHNTTRKRVPGICKSRPQREISPTELQTTGPNFWRSLQMKFGHLHIHKSSINHP